MGPQTEWTSHQIWGRTASQTTRTAIPGRATAYPFPCGGLDQGTTPHDRHQPATQGPWRDTIFYTVPPPPCSLGK